MGVRVTVNGNLETTLADYSVTEDGTPLNGDDSSGGIGQITLQADTKSDSIFLPNTDVAVADSLRGNVTGTVHGVSDNNGELSVTADARLFPLVSVRQADPQNGTLAEAFTYYLSLCGVTENIVVDAAIASRAVTYPGWKAEVWTQLKKLCVAEQVEIAVVGDDVILRPARSVRATLSQVTSSSWSYDSNQLAQKIEVYLYNTEYKENTLVYPPGEWNEEAQSTTNAGWTPNAEVLQVGYSETVSFDVEIGASLTDIQQPVCVSSVGPGDNTASVYTVMGKDGVRTLDPAVWTARGGKIEVVQKEGQPSVLTIKVSSGYNAPELAPFRIAMSSGTDYATLRIVGTGVFTQKNKFTFPTGLTEQQTTNEVGITIDNEFIGSLDQLYRVAARAVSQYAGLVKTIDGSAFGLGLVGAEQVFGNVAGARIHDGDTEYRIRSATVGPEEISYTAEADTMFDDFNKVWAGKTFADFNAAHTGQTFINFNEAPLRKSN